MEFQLWGRLDDNGRIVSVQSQCVGSELSPTPLSSSQSAFTTEAGEKFVPYSTKKELDYKLDNKIDEMSLLIVQMGELTKRMKLQEKLISKYEEDEKRHCSEISRLRAENEELRSLVNKRRRNSSFSSAFEPEASATSPKSLDMITDGNLDNDVDDYMHVLRDESNSGMGIKKQACDNIDKKITPDLAEVDIQLPVDSHGYILLQNSSPTLCKYEVPKQDSFEDETFMFQTNLNVNFSIHKQSIHKVSHQAEKTNSFESKSLTFETTDVDTVDGPVEENPDTHSKQEEQRRYVEIPECLVTPEINTPERPKTLHNRPPMPLPDKPSPTRSEPRTPGVTSQQLNTSGNPIAHRHSSPDLRDEIIDEKLRKLYINMKTTMEWNEARKLLMSKSYDCTAEKAEDSLKAIVKETYVKCFKRLVIKGQVSSTEILAMKMLNHLKKKNQHDEDILTKTFLEKCINLMHTL